MKKILVTLFIFCTGHLIFAQNSDPGFAKKIAAFAWMPDGKDLLLNIVRFDKTNRVPPTAKKFRYSLLAKKNHKVIDR